MCVFGHLETARVASSATASLILQDLDLYHFGCGIQAFAVVYFEWPRFVHGNAALQCALGVHGFQCCCLGIWLWPSVARDVSHFGGDPSADFLLGVWYSNCLFFFPYLRPERRMKVPYHHFPGGNHLLTQLDFKSARFESLMKDASWQGEILLFSNADLRGDDVCES